MTTDREPLLRDRRFAFDFALSVVVGLTVTFPYLVSGLYGPVAVGIVLASALMLRRLMPQAALLIGAVGALGSLVVSPLPMVSIVVVPMLVYAAARWGGRQLGQTALTLALAGALLGPARWALQVGSAGALIYFALGATGCAGVALAAYLVGRRRRESVENLRERELSELERSRLLLAEQQQRAAVAAVDERNRIARDLHDIVAHSLSVIVVQAEGGKALALKRPEKGPEVLGTIAETSREALEEMRRMVGLLRSGAGLEPEQPSYVPTPGLDEIPELVRKTSDRAELAVFGEVPQVSQALGLTAYRIVQESLTNVLKHAGPAAAARVTLAFTASAVEIEVTDDGRGVAATGDGLGHGLQGMQERVAVHGGVLTAGPRPAGGFSVRASLPTTAAEPTVTVPSWAPPRPRGTH